VTKYPRVVVWWSGDDRSTFVEAGEYNGESRVVVMATQLDVPQARANRVVDGWIEFFKSGPTAITELAFRSRTPARLFDSLRQQTQLQKLHFKWGDYFDLTVLSGMKNLSTLELGGASALTSVEPLSKLSALRTLHIEGCRRLLDFGAIGELAQLEELVVWDGFNGPRLHANSLDFVRGLTNLNLLSFSPIVDSLDFSPVLQLQTVKRVRVATVRGMTPSATELERAVPGIAAELARERSMGPPTIRRMRIKDPAIPDPADVLEVLRQIDQVWSDLLDGKRTRLEVVVWARQADSPKLDLPRDGIRALNDLIGYPWAHPPDRFLLSSFQWLEQWRASVRQYAEDPSGEPRRQALRRVAQLVPINPTYAESEFWRYVENGLLGPDDAAAFSYSISD
jgi:hypothetical protein